MLNLTEITNQFNFLVNNSKQYFTIILKIICFLWIFNIINWCIGSILNVLGNIPRSRKGLLGICFSWIPHANFNHLFFNSIPLFILSLLLISYDKKMFFNSALLITLIEGILVWCFARKGNHIGASGLVAGFFGFTLIFAYTTASILSIFLAMIVLYYFGGILLSFFPTEAKTSWESHLFGFLAGISSFFIIKMNLFSFYNIPFIFK